MNNLRNDLLLLSQFGFSNKILLSLYSNKIHYIDGIFNQESDFYKNNKKVFTKKDKELSENYKLLLEFIPEFLSKMKEYKKKNIKILYRFDDRFPENILSPKDNTIFLYILGNYDLINTNGKVAIIGSRVISNTGIEYTTKITKKYVSKNFITISGLAKGVDTIVHKETLNANGRTIAVLPTSFEKVYPKENEDLYYDILNKNGLLITKSGPFNKTYKSNFLDRNTLIAQLCDEIIVTEASINSGTLNTIKKASELEKKIFYIPNLLEKEVVKFLESLGGETYKKESRDEFV